MKRWYTQYRILFTLKKSQEMFSKWMELENIISSNVTQIQTNKSCIFSLISESQIWMFLCEYIETKKLKMVMVPSKSHRNLQTTQTVAKTKGCFLQTDSRIPLQRTTLHRIHWMWINQAGAYMNHSHPRSSLFDAGRYWVVVLHSSGTIATFFPDAANCPVPACLFIYRSPVPETITQKLY